MKTNNTGFDSSIDNINPILRLEPSEVMRLDDDQWSDWYDAMVEYYKDIPGHVGAYKFWPNEKPKQSLLKRTHVYLANIYYKVINPGTLPGSLEA